MNPYTYTKKSQEPAPLQSKGFLRSVMTAKITPLMAFAIVLLAAGSTAAITPLAAVEMSQGQPAVLGAALHPAPKLGSQVLGASILNQPASDYKMASIFSASNLRLSVKPYQYDPSSGNWNYQVLWSRPGDRSGSIYINGNVFVNEATGTASAYTGFTLTPQARYHIAFFSQASGQGVRVANRYFTTLPVPNSATSSVYNYIAPDVEDSNANSSTTPDSGQTHPVGTLINQSGTIFLIVPGGKLGIPDATTFESWNYSFSDAVQANAADEALPVVGIILQRQPGAQQDNSSTPPSFLSRPTSTSSSGSTSTLNVLISIPHGTVPMGMPVRAAAASQPRQDASFSFNWGDGTIDTATSTSAYFMDSHSYAAAGTYTFTATATNSAGVSASNSGSINVGTSTMPSLLPHMPMQGSSGSGTPPSMFGHFPPPPHNPNGTSTNQ